MTLPMKLPKILIQKNTQVDLLQEFGIILKKENQKMVIDGDVAFNVVHIGLVLNLLILKHILHLIV
jgi:hypothetical protein